ncbi:hypothetical protein BST61_g9528 [Cercospora zeina]
MATSVPAVYLRGGTSKALFFHEHDIPPAGLARDRFLMRVMGSPDPMQIDGMGGTYPVTSKIAIIRPSEREDADVDFIFVQVSVQDSFVDYNAGCGNISAGVGPFAINEGLVSEKRVTNVVDGYTTQEVRIYQPLSTKRVLVAHVPIDDQTGRFVEKGDYAIAGCPGSGSPILMDYRYTVGGAVNRGLMPNAHIIAFARASDFGLHGDEHPKKINEDRKLLALVREIRGKAAHYVGMCRSPETVDQDSPILPMVALLSECHDSDEAHIQSRLFLDNACHSAMAGAGATCTAACSRVPGSLVARMMKKGAENDGIFGVKHPGGVLPITIATREGHSGDGEPTFETLSFGRTARYLFRGEVFVPDDLQMN